METDILGFDGKYTITDSGDVFSYCYNRKRKLKPQKASQSKKGYYQVRLHSPQVNKKLGKHTYGKLYYIHRLVWETFKGDIPQNKQIDHIDGDTSNNHIDNLQVLTPRNNMEKYNERKWGPTLRDRRDEFIQLYEKYGTYKKVEEVTGISYQRIYRVVKDIIHYKDFKTGTFKTRRWSNVDDKYTDVDLRCKNGKKDELV